MFEHFKDSARITLNDKFLGDEKCPQLAEFLAAHKRVEALEVKSNDIGPKGFKLIFEALTQNPNLRYLVLEYNDLGALSKGEEGVEELGNLLSVLNKLEYLNLSNNKLTDRALEVLSTPISLSRSLKLVELKFNEVTSKGLKHLAGDLERNKNNTLLFVEATGNKVDKQTHESLE